MNTHKTAAIFDMDGTLADVSGIRHLVLDPARRNFDAFHAASVDAPAHDWVVRLARAFAADGHAIIVVTARKAQWRHHTAWWLALNHVPSHALFMRANHDQRKDFLVKRDILTSIRQTWEPIHAVDDNPSVIALWESENIPVTRVPGWAS